MNPAGSNMPRRIRVSRKTELDRIRKLLAAKNPEPEETPEPEPQPTETEGEEQ